jgi:multiple sugar transport system substrate-binding protein
MNKRKIKLLALTTIASLMITSFVGCKAKETASETKVESKTKIKVWVDNRHDQTFMNEKVEKYNKENKDGIEIEYQIYSDNYAQSLDLAFSTNEPPDIFKDASSAGVFTKLLPQGYLEPLDGYLKADFKKRFGSDAFLEGVNMQNGKIYSLPATGTSTRLIYNKGIFEKAGIKEAPKSIEDVVKYSKIITDKLKGEGIYGFAMNLKSPSSAFSRSLDFMVTRSGGYKAGYDFVNGKYEFSSYKPLLEAFKTIYSEGSMFPGCEALDIDPLRTQFAAGKIGMYISYLHAEPGVYENQFPTKENWDVAQLPTVDGTVKGAQNLQAGTWLVMSSKSKAKDKAWKVMEYLYGDEFLSEYQEKGLGLAVVPSVIEKSKKAPIVEKRPELAFTKYDKVIPNPPMDVKPEGKDMYSVFAEVLFGKTEADKAIQDLNTRYNAALEKSVKDGKTKVIQYKDYDPLNPSKVLQK